MSNHDVAKESRRAARESKTWGFKKHIDVAVVEKADHTVGSVRNTYLCLQSKGGMMISGNEPIGIRKPVVDWLGASLSLI